MNEAIKYVWNIISFPEASLLRKRVPKKQFLESSGLVASDRRLFRENVRSVYWEYTLKPSTCSALPFEDSEREYLEVAILQIELSSQRGLRRIAEIVHRVIPYPLLLGFYTGADEFALSIAPKRFSQSERGAFVADRSFTTGWMNSRRANELETAFIESLAWSRLPLHHYGAMYNAWTERFTAYECSVLSGVFTILETGDRLERLARCRDIELKILELRALLKKEVFNQQVELNIRIKKLEHEFKQLAASL